MALADLKRSFYLDALGLSGDAQVSLTDLENQFYSTVSSAGGAFRFGFNATRLPKWQAAMARVLDNAGDAKILMIGDSQFFGSGSSQSGTLPSNGSPSTRLATKLTSGGVPSIPGFITPGVDQRWTVPGNWSATLFGFGSLAAYTSAVNAGALVCTDARIAWDRCDIYYLQGFGLGTIACTATGGSAANGVGNSGTSTIAKVTASAASASTSNTISIVPTVSNCYVVGVEFWINGSSRVRVGNGGVGTTGVAQHVVSSQVATWGTIPAMNAYQPDLTIIGLGVNDRGASRTTVQYRADMQTLVTAAKAAGDVVLCSEMPSQSAPQATNEAAFNAVLKELSGLHSAPYYDYYGRCKSWASYNSLGMAADALHQNNRGYWDWANGIAPVLLGV
jgi:hypothetical protein